MELSERTKARLKKIGIEDYTYKGLLKALPKYIYKSEDGRHFKSYKTIYRIKIIKPLYTLTFSIIEENNKEYEYSKNDNENLLELLASMILYIHNTNLLDPGEDVKKEDIESAT